MTDSLARSYRFGRFVIDTGSARLRSGEVSVPLRPKSFDVLLYLARNGGRLITKDELFENVWADVVVTDNSLVQCIMEVRQALGDDRQTMIGRKADARRRKVASHRYDRRQHRCRAPGRRRIVVGLEPTDESAAAGRRFNRRSRG